jgi:hypothetical protein
MRSQRATPSVAIGARIPAETDELRRRLQAQLGLSVSGLIQMAFAILERELKTLEPAE